MLGHFISFCLGVLEFSEIYLIYKQIMDKRSAKQLDISLWEYKLNSCKLECRNFFLIRYFFKIYYSKLLQVVLLIFRVILCIVCIGCFIGFVMLLNSDWGELFK